MRINDSSAFLKHQKAIKIDLINGKKRIFKINFNIKTRDYINAFSYIDVYNKTKDNNERDYIVADMVRQILMNGGRNYTAEWIKENITQSNQIRLINTVFEYIDGILQSENCYKIPDIEVKKKQDTNTSKYAKGRKETQDEIKRLSEILKKKNDVNLMDDLVLVMEKTSNTYNDVMNLPILVFRAMVKSIAINEMRTDDDYNLAYLKYKTKEYKDELNSGQAVIAPETRGADLDKIKAFFN